MRIYTEIKMLQVDWQCTKCKLANVKFTGWSLSTIDLAKYEHQCPNCHDVGMYMFIFPYIEEIPELNNICNHEMN